MTPLLCTVQHKDCISVVFPFIHIIQIIFMIKSKHTVWVLLPRIRNFVMYVKACLLPIVVLSNQMYNACNFSSCWDTAGGTVVDKNDSHTVCRYDHMTNFAVLVLYYDEFDPVCINDSLRFLCFVKILLKPLCYIHQTEEVFEFLDYSCYINITLPCL